MNNVRAGRRCEYSDACGSFTLTTRSLPGPEGFGSGNNHRARFADILRCASELPRPAPVWASTRWPASISAGEPLGSKTDAGLVIPYFFGDL